MYFELAGLFFGRFFVDIKVFLVDYETELQNLSSWKEHMVPAFKEFSLWGKIGMFTDIYNTK